MKNACNPSAPTPLARPLAALCCGLMLALPAWSQASAPGKENARQAAEQYRKERADCLAGRSAQDRQTCLKEAAAALAEARRGGLVQSPPQTLADNAKQRCLQVPVEDRAACERLAAGQGQRQGSVAEGAILKEIVERKVEAPASAPR